MSITRVVDCIIAAHEAFASKDVASQKAGLLLVQRALTDPAAAELVAGLEVAVKQLMAGVQDELEDIERMGDDPSVTQDSSPFQPDDLVPAEEEDDAPDEDSDASSPADEELTDAAPDEQPGSETDVQSDVHDDEEEVGTVALITRRPHLVSAPVRHAAACIARVRNA